MALRLLYVCLCVHWLACTGRTAMQRIEPPPITDSVRLPVLDLPDTVSGRKLPLLQYADAVYRDNIRTVLLNRAGFELSHPIIDLQRQEQLHLRFDDLDGGVQQYYYVIIHCNADWTPSALLQHEYIEGFYDGVMHQYRHSFNTLQRYTHYQLIFPNEDFKITKSGNYLLKVYLNNDPEQLVLTRRFMVLETKVHVEARVRQPDVVKYRMSKQAVTFKIDLREYRVHNTFEDIKVVVRQNQRWDNAITGLQPLFVRDNELIYEHKEEILFNGGKEFRHFDIRTLRFSTERVQQIIAGPAATQVHLYPDEPRTYRRYTYEMDINGRYVPGIREGLDPEVEADYVHVYFTLPLELPVIDGSIHIFGALTDWQVSETTEMQYNPGRKWYEGALYLKQGLYNYCYVFVPHDTAAVSEYDEGLTEGHSWETENDYTILVYGRQPGGRYDELIAVRSLNSLHGETDRR